VKESFVSAERTQKRKEVNTMKYAKPEVSIRNAAMAVIQGSAPGSKNSMIPDSGNAPLNHVTAAAYEADE